MNIVGHPRMQGSLFLLLVWFAAALPITTAADLVFSYAPTFQVTHGEVVFYNGNAADPDVPPPPVTVQTSDFSSNTSIWTFEQLVAPLLENTAIPIERGVYIVARIDPSTFAIEGGTAIRGENYDFVHAAWGTDAPETVHAALTIAPLGDPATPSGTYLIQFARIPEFKFLYDPATDIETVSPFTDNDIGKLLENDPNFFADVNYSAEAIFEFIADVPIPSEPDPVIIIPGILGSEQHNGEWIIDPILHTYDDLIATLDENGYTRDVDLFPFPYNWRKSNVETALLLKEKIDDVKAICSCDKVDLVAHSMGGLVARQYIQSDAYEADVDQLIFLGTPHLGAPKAYLMWEGGEVSPLNDFFDELLELLLEHEAVEEGYNTLFEYIHNEPIVSVRELLPVYDYVFDGSNLRSYPANYPRNIFLEDLNDQLADLLNSGVRITNIIGETGTNETIVGIQSTNPTAYLPKWEHGYPDGFSNIFGDHGLIRGQGDKTVPFVSASFVNINSTSTPHIHSALPLETQEYIFRVLTGNNLATVSRQFAGLDLVNLLIFKILSPADLLIVGPDGKKIGKDFNGQEINEILNAFYTGFGTDTEFITILNPLDGEYKIFTQGTGSGPYTVETSFISNAATTDASFTGNTGPGITSQLNLEVEDGGIPPESLDVVVTYESTLADLERIYQLKWVNTGVYKSLKTQLLKVQKARPAVAKILLQAMLKQLKGYRGKLLTEQGYQIIKTDIERLITNLSP